MTQILFQSLAYHDHRRRTCVLCYHRYIDLFLHSFAPFLCPTLSYPKWQNSNAQRLSLYSSLRATEFLLKPLDGNYYGTTGNKAQSYDTKGQEEISAHSFWRHATARSIII